MSLAKIGEKGLLYMYIHIFDSLYIVRCLIGGSKADPGVEPRSRLRAGCLPEPVLQQRVRTLRRCQAGVWRWDAVGSRSYSGRGLTGSQVQYKSHARSGH